MKGLRSKLFACSVLCSCVLMLVGTCSAFVFPSGYLRQHQFPEGPPVESARGPTATDLLSCDLGTFVGYTTRGGSDFSAPENGYVSFRFFPYQNMASQATEVVIGTDCTTGAITESGHRIDMTHDVVTNQIVAAVRVRYFNYPYVYWMDEVYTVRFWPNGTLASGPQLQVRRYSTYYDSYGSFITDIAISGTAVDGVTLYWTEGFYDGSIYEYYQLYGKNVNDAAVPEDAGTFISSLGTDSQNRGGHDGMYIDAAYDPALGKSLIAADSFNDVGTRAIRLVTSRNAALLDSIGSLAGKRHPTIDTYPWTGAFDFAVAYENCDSVGQTTTIGFAKCQFAPLTTLEYLATLSPYGCTDPVITCYATAPTGTDHEVVVFKGGDVLMSVRKPSGEIDRNIEIAKSLPGHPSSTNFNVFPTIAAPSKTTFPLGGFYVIWADNYIRSIYGKHSDNVPFKNTGALPANQMLDNAYECDCDPPVPDTYPFRPFDGDPLELRNCGDWALGSGLKQGVARFVVSPWDGGDQAYDTKVSYTVVDVEAEPPEYPPNLLTRYVLSYTDNDIVNEPTLHDHIPIVAGSYTYPLGTYSPDFYWRFWNMFPHDNDYTGFTLSGPDPGPFWWDYTAHLATQGDARPKITVKYIDWVGDAVMNNECSNASIVNCADESSIIYSGSVTSGATPSADPPCSAAVKDVWYTMAGKDCGHSVNVFFDDGDGAASGFIAIYTGSCGDLTLRACTSWRTPYGRFAIHWVPEDHAQETIYVRVGSSSASQSQSLEFSCFDKTSGYAGCAMAGPPNDECNGATTVVCGDDSTTVFNGDVTTLATSSGTPPCGQAVKDVWYVMAGKACGHSINAFFNDGNGSASGFIAIYTGTCGNLTLRACTDQRTPYGRFALWWVPEDDAQETIYIRVGSSSNSHSQSLEFSCFDKTSGYAGCGSTK